MYKRWCLKRDDMHRRIIEAEFDMEAWAIPLMVRYGKKPYDYSNKLMIQILCFRVWFSFYWRER